MKLMGDGLRSFGDAVVQCQAWSSGEPRPSCSLDDIPAVLKDPQGFLWLELQQPGPDVVSHLQGLFGLHELAIEDVHLAAQRPKLETYSHASGGGEGETLFMVVKPLLDSSGGVELGELHVFLEERVIVLLHLGQVGSAFAALERFRRAPARLGRGRANALHAVLDEVVDDYLPSRVGLEERLDDLEGQVIDDKLREQETLTSLYAYKRDLMKLRGAAQPLEEMTRSLGVSGAYPEWVTKIMRPYFRDVHDHITHLLSELDAQREAHLGLLNLHIALAAHRQGVVVRKLAGWGAILALPTMVFSLYGMNFEVMPELKWTWGYPLVMSLTLLGSVGLHRWLKRSGWL
ncbi:MAG: magnesium and cobalt transport protein CorA [Halothiobacillaceae bacterium]|nr:MAG: magnesium and cobalt transport protein CorA [Halothiobacillaceae bacterium]